MAEPTRVCLECGTDISCRGRNALRCAPCARRREIAQTNAKPRVQYSRTCEYCTAPFTTCTKRARFCSQPCAGRGGRQRPVERACPACGQDFVGWGIGCSRACTAWIRCHPGVARPTECGNCAGPISGRTAGSLYCSRACAGTVMAKRRRAAVRGRPVERVVPRDIFTRDGWTCHLCLQSIDRTQTGRQPLAPSLDHLIPIAHPDYPGHIAANLAAAHWRCNVAKGERATPSDFALYRHLAAELAVGEFVRHRTWLVGNPETHCVFGHEFTPKNTYLRPDGKGRQCVACRQVRSKRQADRKKQRHAAARLARTHCRHGHEWTAENTYCPARGGRMCRRCMAVARRAAADRRRGGPARQRNPNRCEAGHAWTAENIYRPPGQPSKRICRACRRRRAASRRGRLATVPADVLAPAG